MAEVKTKNLIQAIKIEYINSSEKLNLKILADKYGVSYAYLRNCCSREKWNAQRDSILGLKQQGALYNPEGAQECLNILGNTILTPIMLLSEMSTDPEQYLMNKGVISTGKINEFLRCFKQCREEVQNTFNYVNPTDKLKIDTALAKMSLQYGNNDEEDVVEDEFINALRGGINGL
ncbi:MAG: hypothetical protein ACRC7S_17450 [Cetobacterium sp.]